MRRRLALLAVLTVAAQVLLSAVLAFGQTFVGTASVSCPGLQSVALAPMTSGMHNTRVSTVAVGITPPLGTKMVVAAVDVSVGLPFRWRDDGTDPTSTLGIPSPGIVTYTLFLPTPIVFTICGQSIGQIRFIRDRYATNDVTIGFTYYGN